jgi:hypothetical protein
MLVCGWQTDSVEQAISLCDRQGYWRLLSPGTVIQKEKGSKLFQHDDTWSEVLAAGMEDAVGVMVLGKNAFMGSQYEVKPKLWWIDELRALLHVLLSGLIDVGIDFVQEENGYLQPSKMQVPCPSATHGCG